MVLGKRTQPARGLPRPRRSAHRRRSSSVRPRSGAQLAREHYTPPQAPIGPVDRVDSALGVGWRTTCTFGGASTLTDTHVDHDGWAFVVGVLSYSLHATAVEAHDAILATWQWIEADQPVG